jgi:hypothetical protein
MKKMIFDFWQLLRNEAAFLLPFVKVKRLKASLFYCTSSHGCGYNPVL